MISDGMGGGGGSAKSDFISKGSLIKHLMRGGGGVKKDKKSSDIIYGRSLRHFFMYNGKLQKVSFNCNQTT